MASVASQGSAKMPRGFLRRQGYAGQVPRDASIGLNMNKIELTQAVKKTNLVIVILQ